ncbi:MAG: DivIVA domain-containing protein [Actinomycetota bacterium]
MSLTPEDIEKKRFHDAWRGYNHEEVDLFLDELAATVVGLRRQVSSGVAPGGSGGDDTERVRELEAQIDSLRRQAAQAALGSGSGTVAAPDQSDRARELEGQVEMLRRNLADSERNLEQTRRTLDDVTLEFQAAQAAAAARGSATDAREARAEELRGTESLLRRTLIAAQKAADEAVAEAEQQAAESVAEARRVAAQIEADATAQGNAMLAAAQQRIDELELRTQQLKVLYAEHHGRATAFVEEQRQTLERMPSPDEVGNLPARHSLPGPGDPGAEGDTPGFPQSYPEGDPAAIAEGAHAADAGPGEPGPTQEYEAVPLVHTDEGQGGSGFDDSGFDDSGFDDSTRIEESSEPAWALPGQDAPEGTRQEAPDSPWSRPEGAPDEAGSPKDSTDDPDDAGPSVRELFWGKS